MFSTKFTVCALSVLSLLMVGCDPVRTTSQLVRCRVTDSVSGTPVQDAKVSMQWDYDGNVAPAERRPEVQRGTYLWFSSVTGKQGEANLGIEWTVLDRTLGGNPPAWRDWVTGKAYVVRVEKNGAREQQSLVIKPGAAVRGKQFAFDVLAIEQSRYVP